MTIASHLSGSGSKTRLLDVAEDLRRRLIRTGILLLVLSGALFPLAEKLLHWFQVRTAAPLAAFGIADAFLALVTIALGAGAVAALPYGAWEALSAAAKVFPELTRRTRWLFWAAAMLLFFAGLWFCIRITLPYGSRFLLSYGSDSLRPVICVRQFVFYYACLSALTPPVALASFAAAAIANARPMDVGWQAMRFAIAGFIIPFMFIYGPAMVLQGTAFEIAQTVVTGLLGTMALAAAVQGWLLKTASTVERGLLPVAALSLIKPGWMTDVAGFGILAIVAMVQYVQCRKFRMAAS